MRWSRLPGSTEPGESCTGEGHRAQGIAVLHSGELLIWMGRSSRPCEEARGSCVKKEFHTAVILPGHLPHSPLTWRLFVPLKCLHVRAGRVSPFLPFLMSSSLILG